MFSQCSLRLRCLDRGLILGDVLAQCGVFLADRIQEFINILDGPTCGYNSSGLVGIASLIMSANWVSIAYVPELLKILHSLT